MFTIFPLNFIIDLLFIFINSSVSVIRAIKYVSSFGKDGGIKIINLQIVESYVKTIDLCENHFFSFILYLLVFFIFKSFNNVLGKKVDKFQSNSRVRGNFKHVKTWFIYLSTTCLILGFFFMAISEILFIIYIIVMLYDIATVFNTLTIVL
ncbi:unnamed protein product (mitochondrion) [Sympodiomycopsis kandeliae]